MKKTIEINDTLQDRVESAIEEVREQLLFFLKVNPDTDNTPDLHNDLDYIGAIHEIIDTSVPIYTSEIRDIMYLHGQEVNRAFDDAGIGGRDENWPSGWEAAAIYCYIQEQVSEWYVANAGDIFDKWVAGRRERLVASALERLLILYPEATEALAEEFADSGDDDPREWLLDQGYIQGGQDAE